MKKKTIKRTLLIVLGIFGLIIVSIPLTVWLAFGPIHSSGEIQISEKFKIEYEETYNGDFAGEFYDVRFKETDSIIGFHTFRNMDWAEHIFVDSLSDRTFLFIADSSLDKNKLNGYYLISFEADFQNIIDTVFDENERIDYQEKMKEITSYCHISKEYKSVEIIGKWGFTHQLEPEFSKSEVAFKGFLFDKEKNATIDNDFLFLSGKYSITKDTLLIISEDSNKVPLDLRYIIEELNETELKLKKGNQVLVFKKK